MFSFEAIREACRSNQAVTCVLLCKTWLRDHPDDFTAIHYYAEMLYKMTRYDEAIAIYNDAIARFPDQRWAFYNQIGHLHRYRGAFAEAELAYQHAIDEDPDEAASYIFLGAVQARQGKLSEAEATHRLATQCSEGFIDEAYHSLGLVLRGQGRLADAKACFEKAIEISSDYEYEEAIKALNDVTNAMRITGSETLLFAGCRSTR